MGYFQVRYDSRVVNYDRRGFIILSTGHTRIVGKADCTHEPHLFISVKHHVVS